MGFIVAKPRSAAIAASLRVRAKRMFTMFTVVNSFDDFR